MDGLIDEKEEDINTEKEDWLAKEIRMAIKNNNKMEIFTIIEMIFLSKNLIVIFSALIN